MTTEPWNAWASNGIHNIINSMIQISKYNKQHPFGTMKRALGQYYFLLKGKLKVTAEMGLFCLSYNLRRAISLKGVPALIASLG